MPVRNSTPRALAETTKDDFENTTEVVAIENVTQPTTVISLKHEKENKVLDNWIISTIFISLFFLVITIMGVIVIAFRKKKSNQNVLQMPLENVF